MADRNREDSVAKAGAAALVSNEPVLEISDERAANLKKLNLITGSLHLLFCVLMFIITDRDAVAPTFTFYSNDQRGDSSLWGPDPVRRGEVIIGYYSAGFSLLAAIDHLAVGTVLQEKYHYYLRRAQNPFRWIEYSVSASIMHVMVAHLSGVFSIFSILSIFGLTMVTMLWGLEQERSNWRLQGSPELKSLFPFFAGFIPWVFGWTPVVAHFFAGVNSDGDTPDFVYVIIFVILTLDSTFALNMYLQQMEIGAFKDYLYGEWAFIVLSLTSKSLLVWVNWGGTNSVNDGD